MSVVAAGAAALVLVGAGPAAADHQVTVSEKVCATGELSDVPADLITRKANVTIKKDGSARAHCTFTKIPESIYNETVGETWYRPTKVTTVVLDSCWLSGEGLHDFGVPGTGTMTFTPGGTAQLRCYFDDVYAA